MIIFVLITIFFSIFLEFLTSFWLIFDEFVFIDNLYVFIFLIFFLNSFFMANNKVEFNFNFDVLYKFLLFLIKTPNYMLNYVLISFKKIYTFLVYFKNKFYIDSSFIFLRRYFSKYFIIWRPLFKKFSYFGYYRSNRSKWIK